MLPCCSSLEKDYPAFPSFFLLQHNINHHNCQIKQFHSIEDTQRKSARRERKRVIDHSQKLKCSIALLQKTGLVEDGRKTQKLLNQSVAPHGENQTGDERRALVVPRTAIIQLERAEATLHVWGLPKEVKTE